MSFIYPRRVSIRRPNASQAVGAQSAYSGLRQTDETVIASNLPASIQAKSTGRSSATGGLPSASPGPIHWAVYVPKSALAKGMARDRDVIVDDEGERYQVEAAYWNSLGYKLACIRLEAR